MIVTITPNPALDMTYAVHGINLGESHRVSTGRVRAGGKGVNVARVVRQQGYPVIAITSIGGEQKNLFAADLAAAEIDARFVAVSVPTRRSIAIVDDVRRETTVLNERGEELDAAESRLLLAELGALLDSAGGDDPVHCVTGSGSLPPGMPDTFYADLVRAAKTHGIPSVIDATGNALLRAAEAGATVLKPNLAELSEATGETEPRAGARRLLDAGATLVFVSLGEGGLLAMADVALWHAELPQVDGNPTGAGDAAVAAIATAIADGISDPVAILRRAAAWGAAAVLMPLAGEISEDWRDLEPRVTVTADHQQ